jgi:preprotein translocase subunit YajC
MKESLDFATFGFQAVPPAPGRSEAPAEPAQPAPAAESAEGGAPPPGGDGMGLLFPLLIFLPLLVLLFWSSRSQQKKQEAAVAGLKKGDRVLSQSGLVGRLVEIDERYAKVELAPGIKVQMLRTSLLGRDTEEASAKKAQPSAANKS